MSFHWIFSAFARYNFGSSFGYLSYKIFSFFVDNFDIPIGVSASVGVFFGLLIW